MKKGFTLIELLAIIVILAVIALIVTPRVLSIIDEAKIRSFIQNNYAVTKATQNYLLESDEISSLNSGDITFTDIDYLIQNRYLSSFSNPFSSEVCSGYVLTNKLTSNFNYRTFVNCETNANNPSDDKLVARFDLQDNVLLQGLDNYNITFNSASLSSDRFGNESSSYEFDGETQFIRTEELSFSGFNELTISAWINPTRTSGGREISNQRQWDMAPWTGWRFRLISGNLQLKIGDGTNNNNTCYAPVNSNEWQHVVATFDSSGIRLYVNKELRNYCEMDVTLVHSSGEHTIGRYPGSAYFFEGNIDDLLIYERSLSPLEIKMKYYLSKP